MSFDEKERLPWHVAAKSNPPDDDGKDDGKDDDDKKPADDSKAKSSDTAKSSDDDDDDKPETPESRFEDRYPQPVQVADIVGKPLILGDNTRIGTILHVVKLKDDKLALIVPYGGFFGIGARLVAVPIEFVGSIGTAIVSLDMGRDEYEKAATWTNGSGVILALDTPMRVAITRH